MDPHFRRGRCCCPEHARKVSSRLSYDRQWARKRLDQISTERHRLRVLQGRWRDVAFGRDSQLQLERIFGVTVDL